MSIVSLAIRICAAKAFKGKTWVASDRIFQQLAFPLAEVSPEVGEKGKPAIVVYSKNHDYSLERDQGNSEGSLLFMVYMPPNKVDLGQNEIGFEVDNKSSGIAINAIGHQIFKALQIGNGEWANLFRQFAYKITGTKTQYVLIEIEDGVPMPCLEINLEYDAITEPCIDDFGPLWERLDAALRDEDDPQNIIMADLIKNLIVDDSISDIEAFQRSFGLSDAAYQASGLGFIDNVDLEDPLLKGDNNEPEIKFVSNPINVVPNEQ